MKTSEDYLNEYKALHAKSTGFRYMGERMPSDTGDRLFNGRDFERNLWNVFREWAEKRESFRVLDYGCGKARFLNTRNLDGKTFHEFFAGKVQSYYCYDPGYTTFEKYPFNRKFDAVICCDVLEHVPEADIDRVILNIRGSLEVDGVAFFNIGGNLSRVAFADGENTHITIKPAEFWAEKMKLLNRRFYLRHVGNGVIKKLKAF